MEAGSSILLVTVLTTMKIKLKSKIEPESCFYRPITVYIINALDINLSSLSKAFYLQESTHYHRRRNKGRRVVWRRQTLHCTTHYSIPPPLSRSNAVVRSLALGDTDTGELK